MALEDFTTWTSADPAGGGSITVAANSITWNDLQRGEDTTWVYLNKGLNFFNGDFTHSFQFDVPADADSGNGAWIYIWMLANSVQSPSVLEAGAADYIGFFYSTSVAGVPTFALRISDDGTPTSDTSPTVNWSTSYYITINRDDDGGVNGTGRVTVYICTGNYYSQAGYSLFDTLTLDCGVSEQNDYQYIFATIPRGGTSTAATDGVVRNFELSATVNAFIELAATASITLDGTATLTAATTVEITATGSLTLAGTGTLSYTMSAGGDYTFRKEIKKLIAIGSNSVWIQD